MANVGAVVSSIRNIMRQDRGISGDAQRLEQLGWMLFLKIIDDKDKELEIIKDNYVSVIPEKFQWRNWAADPEGMTGDELLEFIDSNAQSNKGLFASLRELNVPNHPKRAAIVREVFEGSNNYMKSGYEMRKVINKLNEIDFNNSEDKHIFGNIYESILQELRDAGNKGEYYTPRAVTQLMTQMTNPKLGEKVLDPAAGTGGFLTAAIDHVRENFVKTVDDEHILQNSITGWELKPVAYVLGLTNLILHEMDVPDYHYIDSLKKEYNSIGKKDQVDVILANPPFGASIADGVETNFPATYRCKESADLFVILMLQLLKPNGRCAIVLPDGSITGDGVKARIRKKLLTDTNLHTIIRLPQTTFFPAMVSTNLLFFEKGSPTKEIWYYEHKLPEGQKSYSKTKPIQFEEFQPIIDWWDNRVENEFAWKVSINSLNNLDLDIKNPTQSIDIIGDPSEHFLSYSTSIDEFYKIFQKLINELDLNQHPVFSDIWSNHSHLLTNTYVLSVLKESILTKAIQGGLTSAWRVKNPNVESGAEVLQKIDEEKEHLIRKKVIRKEKPLPPITQEEIPYELPENWIWCRIPHLFSTISTRGKQIQTKEFLDNGLYPVVDQGQTLIGGYHNDKSKIIKVESPLVVFGDHTKQVKYIDFDFIPGADGTKVLEIFKPLLPKYFYYVLSATDIGDKGYSRHFKVLKSKLFPICPLEEQKAIVQSVEKMLQEIEKLEALLKNINSTSHLLLKSVLHEAFQNKKVQDNA